MTTHRLTFCIDRSTLISSNMRLHFHAKARRAALLRELAGWTGKAARIPTILRADLVIHVGWPDRIRRDRLNLEPTFKPLLDGLVDAKVLVDDSDSHILSTRIETDSAFCDRRFYACILHFDLTER